MYHSVGQINDVKAVEEGDELAELIVNKAAMELVFAVRMVIDALGMVNEPF